MCKEVLYPGSILKYLVCLLRAQVSMDFIKMECTLTEILNFAHNFFDILADFLDKFIPLFPTGRVAHHYCI